MTRKILDLWKLDPNWWFATQHGQATRTGLENPQIPYDQNNILMCPCCLKVIHKQPMNICQNPKQLHFLGYGFPLFYNMLQYCMISLGILILVQAVILLYLGVQQTCVQGDNPDIDYKYPCQNWMIFLARVTRNREQLKIDRIVRCLGFFGQGFLLVYIRDKQRKLGQYHQQRNIRIKDFSVIFKNLPNIPKIQNTIVNFLQSLQIYPQIKIQQIFLIPKIDYFHELQQRKKQIIQYFKQKMKAQQCIDLSKDSLLLQLEKVNYQMIQTCKNTYDLYLKDQLSTEKAIIILQTQEIKNIVISKFNLLTEKQKQKHFFWMADQVTLQSAPQPRQIIWNHINYPKYKRWLSIILGWTLSIIFLAAVTGLFYPLAITKAKSHSTALLIISLILIQFFNKYIMKIFLHWFSDIEMPQTSSQRQFSYACKYSFGMFFTTAVMSILVEVIIYQNLQFQHGVVQGETIMFFFNAFIVNLLWTLHPQYYLRKLRRWYYYGKRNITQKQANKVMQDYPYDMGKRYAEILQTMWFSFLYVSLIPFGVFLSLIGLWIYYWVDKYNLLRRSKVQNTIQSKLPLKAVKLLQLTLFWNAIGILVFDYRLRQTIFAQTYVMIGISIIFLFIPWNKFLDRFFNEKFNISKETYQQVKHRFNETYQTVDPIQRMLVLQKFIQDQNNERRRMGLKDRNQKIPNMIQIKSYGTSINMQDKQVAKSMVRQQIPQYSDDHFVLQSADRIIE